MATLIRAARRTRARTHLPWFILVAFYTGARKHAILGLQNMPATTGGWIDMERGVIVWEPSTTKKHRPRETPIPSKLMLLLPYLLRKVGRYLIEEVPGHRIKDIRKGFAAAAKLAGIKATPHTLRHTRASIMVQEGTPLREAAKFLGMTTDTLDRVYAHHAPDYLRRAAEAVGRKR